jgi:hypothetical protein
MFSNPFQNPPLSRRLVQVVADVTAFMGLTAMDLEAFEIPTMDPYDPMMHLSWRYYLQGPNGAGGQPGYRLAHVGHISYPKDQKPTDMELRLLVLQVEIDG